MQFILSSLLLGFFLPTLILSFTPPKRCIAQPTLTYLSSSPSSSLESIPLLQTPPERFPLPSDHLSSPELATLNIYAINPELPDSLSSDDLVGHLTSDAILVGSIGCASRILLTEENQWIVRGAFRFRVEQVEQEIPYPVVQVTPLYDDEDGSETLNVAADDDEEEEEALYQDWSADRLYNRLQQVISEYGEEILKEKELSPLEKAILQDSQVAVDPEQSRSEEKMAVWQVFCASTDGAYRPAAYLAAEIADLDTTARKTLLKLKGSTACLRFVVQKVEESLGMMRARALADQITDQTDESERDLKVGVPTLPPWAKSIRKGHQVEYFWNEEYEWCLGEVVEDPVQVGDEILLTVYFPDDDETHKLPLSADEKARWRPPQQ